MSRIVSACLIGAMVFPHVGLAQDGVRASARSENEPSPVVAGRSNSTGGESTQSSSPRRSFEDLASVVQIGERVRVHGPDGVLADGTVAGLTAEELVLEDEGGTLTLPRDTIARLDVAESVTTKHRGALGFLIGAGIGAGIGAALLVGCPDNPNCTQGLAMGGTAVFVLGFGAFGAIAGRNSKREEVKWSPVYERRGVELGLVPLFDRRTQGLLLYVSW